MNWELNTIATDIQLVIQISPWLAVIIYNRNAYSVKPLVCLQLKCLANLYTKISVKTKVTGSVKLGFV